MAFNVQIMKILSILSIITILLCTMLNSCIGTPVFREAKSHYNCLPIKGRARSSSICPLNMEPYGYYKNGTRIEYICDCLPNYVYFFESDNCHRVFSQGPCPENHYVVLGLNDTEPSCFENPCKQKSLILFQGQCHYLGSRATCPDQHALAIDPASVQLVCEYRPRDHDILYITPSCRHGTKRDRCNICRPVLQGR